jgi:hypothetical protein
MTDASSSMLPDNYANDLLIFHSDLLGFIASHGYRSTREAVVPESVQRLCLAKFNELCADVYDEIRRRHALVILQGLGDFDQLQALPPLPSMHPRRNSARRKLSTLPIDGLAGLCVDIIRDLERRFPAVGEQPPAIEPRSEPPPRYTLISEHIPIAMTEEDNWI